MTQYVIASKPHDGAPDVFGPFTLDQATDLLKMAQQKHGGEYSDNSGYWSDHPSWSPEDVGDEIVFVIVELRGDQEKAFLSCAKGCVFGSDDEEDDICGVDEDEDCRPPRPTYTPAKGDGISAYDDPDDIAALCEALKMID